MLAGARRGVELRPVIRRVYGFGNQENEPEKLPQQPCAQPEPPTTSE